MLVAATLTALVFIAIYSILVTSSRVTDAISAERIIESETETLVARLRSDIESGRVVAASGSLMTVATAADTVTYAWSGAVDGNVVRTVAGASDTLSTNVSLLDFVPRTFQYDRTIEAVTTLEFPATAASFEPGDWDVATPPCSYQPRGQAVVTGTNWVGLAFESSAPLSSFVSARVRASAQSGTPDGDLVLEIYRAAPSPPYAPDNLLAQARINTAGLTATPEWVSGTLVPVDETPVPATTALWLVARALYSYHTFAADLEYERISCPVTTPSEIDNGMDSHGSFDGGANWFALPETEELFAIIVASTEVEGLFEVPEAREDTTGVAVTLSVTRNSVTEERVLEIASIDP